MAGSPGVHRLPKGDGQFPSGGKFSKTSEKAAAKLAVTYSARPNPPAHQLWLGPGARLKRDAGKEMGTLAVMIEGHGSVTIRVKNTDSTVVKLAKGDLIICDGSMTTRTAKSALTWEMGSNGLMVQLRRPWQTKQASLCKNGQECEHLTKRACRYHHEEGGPTRRSC